MHHITKLKYLYIFVLFVWIGIFIYTAVNLYKSCNDEGVSEAVKQLTHDNNVTAKWIGAELRLEQQYLDIIYNSEGFVYFWDARFSSSFDTSEDGWLSSMISKYKFKISSKNMETVRDFDICNNTRNINKIVSIVLHAGVILSFVLLVLYGCSIFDSCCSENVLCNRAVGTRVAPVCIQHTMSEPSGEDQTASNNVEEGGNHSNSSPHFLRTFLPCMDTHQGNNDGELDLPRDIRSGFKKDVDGTQTAEQVALIKETMRSVGVLFIGNQGTGTVVRVGSRYVITAWHVIKSIVCPPDAWLRRHCAAPGRLKQRSIYVDFSENCRNSLQEMHFWFLPKLVFWDIDLDIVVLELDVDDGNRNHLPPPIQHITSSLIKDTHSVILIGQHPKRDEKVVDFQCKIITHDDKKVAEARRWKKKHQTALKKKAVEYRDDPTLIDKWFDDLQDVDKYLTFDTYLARGGSGGAVIAHRQEGDVMLVAILSHGLPNFDSHSENKYNIPDEFRMEVGRTMKAIYESPKWLGKESIRDEIFSSALEPMDIDDQGGACNNAFDAMELDP